MSKKPDTLIVRDNTSFIIFLFTNCSLTSRIYLCHFAIPFTIPFPVTPSPSSPPSFRPRNPKRNSWLTDPDSQWVVRISQIFSKWSDSFTYFFFQVQMIRFEDQEWEGDGGKYDSTTDKTPLLNGRERYSIL